MNYYLYHHGIKGQKWGRRNGPPYPLGASDHSASERKAGWRSSCQDLVQSKSQKKNGSNKVSKTTRAGEISPEMIELGVMSVASLAYVAAIRMSFNKRHKNDIQQNKSNNTSNIQKKIKGAHSESQDMAKINPDYKTGKPENLMNCTMCTTAYEMRRRGYDVQANVTKMGRRMEDVASWFDIPKNEVYKTRDYGSIKKKLESEPDGSRGNIFSGVGMFDSYHSMIWEKKGGKVIIRDAQSNEVYKSIDSSIINKKSAQQYQYVRTDNRSINWDNIRDAVVERED